MSNCEWHGPYTGEITGCCIHNREQKMENEDMVIKAEIDVPIEKISDLLISAIEAGRTYGCGYWGYAVKDMSVRPVGHGLLRMQEYLRSAKTQEVWYGHWVLFDGVLAIEEHYEESDNTPIIHRLSRVHIRSGLRTMATDHDRFGDIFVEGRIDGPLGDVFLQYCIFGDEKY